MIPRLRTETEAKLNEARTWRYRLRRWWLRLVNQPVPPSEVDIQRHVALFGVAPGFVITPDELAAFQRGEDLR